MKNIIFLEILKELKSNPALMKKAKIAGGFALVFCLLISGLAVWAGISILSHVASTAGQVITSPKTQERILDTKARLEQIQFQPLSCLEKAQSLIAIEPWIANTMMNNFLSLKTACLESSPSSCETGDCEQVKDQNFKTEGRII